MPIKPDTLDQLRAALEASESRHAALAGQLPYKLFVKDLHGTYEFANARYAADLGLPPEQVVGKDDFAFFPRELAERYQADDRRVADSGDTIQVEEPYVHDGRTRWIRTTKAPVRRADGSIRAVLGMFEDITEQHDVEVARERDHRLFEAVWSHSLDALFIADAETGILLDASPSAEALTGRSRADLVGSHQSTLHPPQAGRPNSGQFEEAVKEPQYGLQAEVLHADGSVRPVNIVSTGSITLDGHKVVIGAFRDMSMQVERERELARLNWSLAARDRANSALIHAQSREKLMNAVCETLTADDALPLAWIAWRERDAQCSVRAAASAGRGAAYISDLSLTWADEPRGHGPTGTALRTGTTQVLNDLSASMAYGPWRDKARSFGLAASAALPIQIDGEVVASLNVYAAATDAFGPPEIALFEQLAADIGFGIGALRNRVALEAGMRERENQAKRLQEVFEKAITTVAAVVERRDPYTSGHEQRVAVLADAIGRELGMDEHVLHGLNLAAKVHDLGKVQVPAEILNMPRALTPVELRLVQTHAQAGYEVLKDVDFPWPIAEIIRQHHERLDGSGYPQGLKGDEILPEARVLMVADIVETMISHRPYRPSLGLDKALAEIQAESGRTLDPAAVDACVHLFRDKGFTLPKA